MFDSGPQRDGPRWYLTLLNLYDDGPGAVKAVAGCIAKAKNKPTAIEAMLRSADGWRPQLVGCVATLAVDAADRPIDALLRAACASSWVSPQLVVTVSFVAPAEFPTIDRAIAQRNDAKAAAALAAIADSPSAETARLAGDDRERGGAIASGWQASIRRAFEDAGVPHSW
jgi:hypothetical protein